MTNAIRFCATHVVSASLPSLTSPLWASRAAPWILSSPKRIASKLCSILAVCLTVPIRFTIPYRSIQGPPSRHLSSNTMNRVCSRSLCPIRRLLLTVRLQLTNHTRHFFFLKRKYREIKQIQKIQKYCRKSFFLSNSENFERFLYQI